MSQMIKVGMADLNICKSPNAITTLGLGSCIGIAIYDPVTKIGGLAHIMLPDSTKIRNNSNIAKFADTGIVELVNRMVRAGAGRTRMVAKIGRGKNVRSIRDGYNRQHRREKCACVQKKAEGAGDTADRRRYRA